MSYRKDVIEHTQNTPRDSQRSKVYRAESMFNEQIPPTLGREQTATLIHRICNDYIVPRIGVIFVNDRHTIARGSFRHIIIPAKKAYSTDVALHETAHGLANWYTLAHDEKEAWHGRTFARIACDLYVRYGKLDQSFVLACMKEHRVKLATRHSCKPPPRNVTADWMVTRNEPYRHRLAHQWRTGLPPARKQHPGNPNISECLRGAKK